MSRRFMKAQNGIIISLYILCGDFMGFNICSYKKGKVPMEKQDTSEKSGKHPRKVGNIQEKRETSKKSGKHPIKVGNTLLFKFRRF